MSDAEAITHRRILKIALPMMLSGLTVPLLGLVDTGVVGHLGAPEPIGAVGIGALILASAYWIFGFLRMGVTGLAAQAQGRGDEGELVAILMRALLIGLGAGLLFWIGQRGVIWLGLEWSPASAGVEALAEAYMRIRLWGAPAAICMFALNGWLIAAERTGAVLLLQLVVNGLNILLDLAFVIGLGWGVEGVALASLIAEWCGFALGLWLCRSCFATPRWRAWGQIAAGSALRKMVAVNADILIRSVILQLIFILFLFKSAGLGDELLAVNQILLLFVETAAYGLDGFAFAAEVLVGRAVGQRSAGMLRRAAVLSGLWSLAIGLLLSSGLWFFGAAALTLMTDLTELHDLGLIYLPWVAAVPVIGVAGYWLDGIFIGATQTRAMRNMMILSGSVYFLALPPLMAHWANHGIWAALLLSLVARGVSLAFCYPALERRIGAN